jgi:pyruvate dehydrogenase E1 component
VTPYVNTIAVEQPPFPGDLAIEERLASLMRWNALAMVARANRRLRRTGRPHRQLRQRGRPVRGRLQPLLPGPQREQGGDLVFFQPHSAPGVYARAFLEGRLSEDDLAHYRQEITAPAAGRARASSYPHPWLMPDFWQFPTGSMGIGPISSIYHARFMRYLTHRNLLDCEGRKVWGVFGDGEMDEPESMSALTLASREKLDNLVWVVNCNLQRLDGPVRGNGRIVDELEKLFRGAGWNVDQAAVGQRLGRPVRARRDRRAGARLRAHRRRPDADLRGQGRPLQPRQLLRPERGARAPGAGMTDEQIDRLKRGGHDLVKIHAAYDAAAKHRASRP